MRTATSPTSASGIVCALLTYRGVYEALLAGLGPEIVFDEQRDDDGDGDDYASAYE